MPSGGIDTPDFQTGVVSAQKLLASCAAGVTERAVYVPVNAETLIIVATEQNAISSISVTGNTTGISCPLSSISAPEGSGFSPTWYADVSSVLDDAVTVSITFGVASAWYIYADSGVHMVSDTNKAVNNQRVQYTIPIPPDTASGDHPYNNLSFAHAYLTAVGVAFAAPGAGKRYRVFSAQGVQWSGTPFGYVQDSLSGQIFAMVGGNAQFPINFLPYGLPLEDNAAVNYGMIAGNGAVLILLTYTIETI